MTTTDTAPDTAFETVKLLRFETIQLRSPTVPRITFYDGQPPMEFIRERVTEICEKNPWLQGKLLRSEGRVMLRYPKRAGDIDRYLRVISLPDLRFESSFEDYVKAFKDLSPKRGTMCVDKDEDLFRVIVVNISENRFAVVVAMSHVYSDGSTFYQINNMLSSTEPVRALIAERIYSSRADTDKVMRGGDDTLPWMGSPGFIANVVGTLLRRRPTTLNLFHINQKMVGDRKTAYEAHNKPKFISANDVIVSDFFSRTGCDLMFQTINFRERIPHLTRDHAGNYQSVIAYQRQDFETPELIRRGFTEYRRAVSGKLPGFFRSTRVKMGAVTNAAGFYKEVELPGCQTLSHRPVIVDYTPLLPFEQMVFVFKSRKDQLSVITCSKNPALLAGLEVLAQRVV